MGMARMWEFFLAKDTMKKIVQAHWSYLEGTPLKRAACGARGPQHQEECIMWGRRNWCALKDNRLEYPNSQKQ